MASTQLKRKAQRNRAKAKKRVATIKRLSSKPVIKNVDIEKIKEEFEKLKAASEPDIIFTHGRDDLHQDHRIIHELTWNTFRNHCILEYEIPKYDGDLASPNSYIPVTEEAARAKTVALMKFFGTQANKHWFCEELFLGLMRIRGMECCSPSGYAEGFYVRKACIGVE